MPYDTNGDLFENNEHEPHSFSLPQSLSTFDVEVIARHPLLHVYVCTTNHQTWEQAKEAFRELGDLLSPESFIELEEKDMPLKGVYASNLTRILTGSMVEIIREGMYRLQNYL
ncbi:MAG: hypothetical protein ABI324_24155 [Ktedonobacteraceae bacterium]